jgi:hypothetical protein
MTNDHLNAILAEHIMGWSVAPDRFLTGQRGWIPRWKFRPIEYLADAFRLLEAAKPRQYTMHYGENGLFTVQVQLGKAKGEARGSSKPRSISYAVARAARLEVGQI